jgi:Xaa-Pro aminopeptidase
VGYSDLELLPRDEAADRLRRIQRWMQENDVDATFVLQNTALFYFAGTVQAGLLCLPSAGDPIYLVQKSLTRAAAESPWNRLVPLRSLRAAPDILGGEGLGKLRRLGLELDILPASYYLRLQALFPDASIVDASDAVRRTRMIKSPYEIAEIMRGGVMLAHAFREIPGWLEPGVTELELHARLEGFLRRQGHQGITRLRGLNSELAYGTVSSGPTACYPTSFPGPVGFVGLYPGIPNGGSRRVVEAGDPVMFDVVGGHGGYIADKTRVFVRGDLAPDLARAHAFVLELLREIESGLKPGRLCSQVYASALARVRESPYADRFMGVGDSQVRFVGHGVGLELDEIPVLASGFDVPLEAGMTIAIEPKLFFPGRGGVGVENTYLITESGFEILTPFEEDVIRVPA